MLIDKRATVVFAGDSITDMGRKYEAEPGGWDSWGNGYVALINAALTAMYPERKISVINQGINGNDINLLAARWDRDILSFQPDYVSVLIGVNDVWRHFDSQFRRRNDLISPEAYQETYEALIAKTQPLTKQMVIIEPFMWELNLDDPMRHALIAYQQAARQAAEAHGLIFVEAQAAVNAFLQQASVYSVTQDRVHPNLQGAMVIAKAWLDAVQTDWSR